MADSCQTMRPVTVRALMGLVLGAGFAALLCALLFSSARDVGHPVQKAVADAIDILNVPGSCLGFVWSHVLHLPPHFVDMPPRPFFAWLVVYVGCAMMQWGFIGFLVGTWWGFKSTSPPDGNCRSPWPVFCGIAGPMIACGLLVYYCLW
jgi:hypothetical protein